MTTVNVTALHIAEGIPGDVMDCPVALAVDNAFPDILGVIVGFKYITIHDAAGQSVLLRIPDDVIDAIRAIDSEKPVEPFTFELDYPAAVAA